MTDVHCSVLAAVDEATTAALGRLLPQVSETAAPLSSDRIQTVLDSPSTYIVTAAVDGDVVGMALLCVCTTLKGEFGLVEEVAVDDSARGKHIGVHLMVTLLEHAQTLRLDFVELTSRQSRVAANGLYQSLGFEIRDTNVYRHRLNSIPAKR